MVTDTQHTPGPWTLHPRFPDYVVPAHDAHKGIGGSVDPDQEHELHAKQIHRMNCTEYPEFHRSRVTKTEAQANAHLIAAAPELLGEHRAWAQMFGEALIRAVQGDYSKVDELAAVARFTFVTGSPELVSEAIAKAEGV